jgi:ribosomal protein S18 acetylase RimI-like enzyme
MTTMGLEETTDRDRPAYRVVAVSEDTRADFVATDLLTWFDEVDERDPEPGGALDWERSHAATATGEPPFAGVYSSYPMAATVPGPGTTLQQVPMAGLSWVGVHPDHRRRGVLTAMLDHHFADLHHRGEALAGLHASETGIYGRFGYAVAAADAVVELGSGVEPDAPGVDTDGITTELLTLGDDGVRHRVYGLHLALAPTTLGQVTRTARHADHAYRDRVADLRGAEPRRVLLATRDGADVGYAVLRRRHKWEQGRPQGVLTCSEHAAADPAVLLALLRRLTAFDLIGTVELLGVAVDSPAIWWLGGPRACLRHVFDGVWLRLVDVGAALEQRGYAAACDVVLEVDDDRCPWNAGRWRLAVDADGTATCRRTGDDADLRADQRALAAMYTGGRRAGELAAQGWLRELRPGALAELGAAMATLVAPVPGVGF